MDSKVIQVASEFKEMLMKQNDKTSLIVKSFDEVLSHFIHMTEADKSNEYLNISRLSFHAGDMATQLSILGIDTFTVSDRSTYLLDATAEIVKAGYKLKGVTAVNVCWQDEPLSALLFSKE